MISSRPGPLRQASPILAGLMAVVLALGWSATHPAVPTLELVGKPSVDCGTMARGTFGHKGWEIRNLGTMSLRLRTRFTSGRSGFSLWQGAEHRVAPGDRITVHLTWPVPAQSSVPFASYAILGTSDPARPEVRLRVVGRSGPPSAPPRVLP